MPGATTQTLSTILQRNYLPGIIRQFNDDFPNLRFIRQNTEDVTAEGLEAVVALETGLNEGGGFHGESADVAQSGAPTHREVTIDLKQMTFRSRITYRLMRKARTRAHAFARGAQTQMSATRDAFTLTANAYLWGDGTGVMARVKAEDLAANDTLTLDEAYGLSDGGAPDSIIRPNQVLHILDTSTFQSGVTNDRGTGEVSTVDDQTGTAGEIDVVFKSGYTFSGVTAGDYVFLQNTIEGWTDPGEAEDNQPAMGLLGFFDHALRDPLQGLAIATEPQWKARKVATAQATVVADVREAKNQQQKQLRNARTMYHISSFETHSRYTNEVETRIEFRNVQRIDGFWEVQVLDGRPWFRDHTAPDARLFHVPGGAMIQRYAVDDFINFIDEGGGVLQRVENKTVFDALLTAVYEYGIKRRNVLVSNTGMDW